MCELSETDYKTICCSSRFMNENGTGYYSLGTNRECLLYDTCFSKENQPNDLKLAYINN